jgi:TM2 domain-containing membrane protein YozV
MYPGAPEFSYIQGLNDQQRAVYLGQYNANKKDGTVAVLLALFLGGVGAHRFYMGEVGLGILYAVFFWTLIPGLIAFVEIFLMSGRVSRYNLSLAETLAGQVRLMMPTPMPQLPSLPPTNIS